MRVLNEVPERRVNGLRRDTATSEVAMLLQCSHPHDPRAKVCAACWQGQSSIERFWTKVQKTESCWLWQGPLSHNGYGRFWYQAHHATAHRFIYKVLVGPIPDGWQIDHLCGVRNCVRVSHLEAVTPQENTLRSSGLSALNAQKTHCPRGHVLIGKNLIESALKTGRRSCRICRNEQRKKLAPAPARSER